MKRKSAIRVMTIALALIFLVGGTAWAAFRETRINYYSDDTFATQVGQQRIDCYGGEWFFGSTGPWRIYDQYSCWSGRREVHRCQQSDGIGGWFDITCPF
jgi:hypothetical protein